MKLRLASIAFLLGSACTAISWGVLRPTLFALLEAVRRSHPALFEQVRGELLGLLAVAVVSVVLCCFVVLLFTVGRPLERTRKAIEQLGRVDDALPFESTTAPLLANVERSLRKMSDALRVERDTTSRQLTELRSAYEELARTQTELLASERLATVGRLAAGVAHEIGNPLSGIFGYLSLLDGDRSPQERKEFLRLIEAELRRIDQIVRGLLDLGRPAGGETAPVSLRALCDSCIALVTRGADFREVQVEVSVPPDCVVRASSGPLSQIVINLLINAAQAIDGAGTIRVAAFREGSQVSLTVEDTGAGIPAETLPQVFEPFFTTKPAGKGTGLGLAVSRHLVSAMGGAIRAENGERGARFVVRLPVA